jgi:glutaminase
MVNAGAIACSGLIHGVRGADAFATISSMLGRFAGRELAVDEAVFLSEQRTGDRNRAIGWLLKNYSVVKDDVDAVLDVYFRQCAILVTARDLAVMAATLANRGVNPFTGDQVIRPGIVAQTLSVMTSSGMYDYAGEWIFRVGIPAKSGVGGGIAAAIPSQIGIGTFAPRLDPHGNSVRGLKVCEALSNEFDMHMLNRSADVTSCIIADYDLSRTSSRRNRRPGEQELLNRHPAHARILEFVGGLSFAHMDYVARHLTRKGAAAPLLILDFRRVSGITAAAARVLGEHLAELAASGVTPALAGFDRRPALWKPLAFWAERIASLRRFDVLDEAIEWAEDQLIARHGGAQAGDAGRFGEHALLRGLTDEELAHLREMADLRSFSSGERILQAGDAARSIFFILSGRVTVRMPSGIRLASLAAGMEVGEQAILGQPRTADVWADGEVSCVELTLEDFAEFRRRYPDQAHRIMTNLAEVLSRRLRLANAKIDALGA